VAESLQECYQAGIRVIMITGDYSGTAQFIARQIGLKNNKQFIMGSELAGLTEEQLRKQIKNVNIFSRIMPEQKLMIVNALKANGEIVAMTGDGVNDAPALKAAHIGVAMGGRGTDVARAAADLVLLEDDFSSIVQAIRLGRRIFDNLKKAIAFIFAIHIPIAGISLLPIVFNLPLVLFPIHVAFLELIIDPACSTVFEMEEAEKNIMNRPPRNLKQSLFGGRILFLSLFQGLSSLAIVVVIYLSAIHFGFDDGTVRSLAFGGIVLGILILIITNLSHSRNFFSIITGKNKALALILCVTILFLLLSLYVPFLRQLFYFSFINPWQLLLVLALSVVGIVWFEVLKVFNRRRESILIGDGRTVTN
jgi:Ca2+-transporting ATPase